MIAALARGRTAVRHLLAAVLLVGLGACATSIVTPQSESQWGAEMARQVEARLGLYQDEDLQVYLQAVGDRLVAALGETPYTFRFAIVDQFEPNAFALPGGYIYVSRGLLPLLNSEAELAGVLAHEISHVTQRHHTRQVGRELGAGLLTLPGRAVGLINEDLGAVINAPIATAEAVFLSSYSRGQESEADDVGLRLAARAGYSPAALAATLTNLDLAVRALTGEEHEASFFDSHPTTPERVRRVRAAIDHMPVTERAPLATPNALLGLLDGLWVGPGNPQQGVFRDNAYLHVDLGLGLAFPANWETRDTPTFVSAASPDDAGRILMTSLAEEDSITAVADELVAGVTAREGSDPTERRSLSVGGWPAELVVYRGLREGKTFEFTYLFVAAGATKLLLLAESGEAERQAVRDSLLSLHPLTEGERRSIVSPRLRLATVREGETLRQASIRAGSLWGAEYTAAANGGPAGESAPAGTRVKIARREVYEGR